MKKIVCLFTVFFCTLSLFAERPIVQDIVARTGKGSKINITWTLPAEPDEEISSLLLYRNTKQITSYSQIESLEPITELSADMTGYTDTVPDFNDYYYAVITVTNKPNNVILLSFNSTITGAHVATKVKKTEPVKKDYDKYYPEGTLRETPLPYIDLFDGIDKNEVVSSEVQASTNSLLTSTKQNKAMLSHYIFEEDLVSPDAGDDYLLFEILKTSFVTRKYNDAISQLTKLIGTNISESTRNRAIFYLGEAEYLSGNFEDSVRTFVKVEQAFPTLVKKWLDSALDRI